MGTALATPGAYDVLKNFFKHLPNNDRSLILAALQEADSEVRIAEQQAVAVCSKCFWMPCKFCGNGDVHPQCMCEACSTA